jgi:hypothetical protein
LVVASRAQLSEESFQRLNKHCPHRSFITWPFGSPESNMDSDIRFECMRNARDTIMLDPRAPEPTTGSRHLNPAARLTDLMRLADVAQRRRETGIGVLQALPIQRDHS